MQSRDFCYWLQGLFELGSPLQLDARQSDLIKRHLAMVFVHEIDPTFGNERQQAKLDAIHNPPLPSPTAPIPIPVRSISVVNPYVTPPLFDAKLDVASHHNPTLKC